MGPHFAPTIRRSGFVFPCQVLPLFARIGAVFRHADLRLFACAVAEVAEVVLDSRGTMVVMLCDVKDIGSDVRCDSLHQQRGNAVANAVDCVFPVASPFPFVRKRRYPRRPLCAYSFRASKWQVASWYF